MFHKYKLCLLIYFTHIICIYAFMYLRYQLYINASLNFMHSQI